MTENRKALEGQINADWGAGRFIAAYDKISINLVPILRDSLKSRRIGHQDAEDIVATAIQKFLKKTSKDGPESISEPCHYLQVIITHERVNHFRDADNRVAMVIEHDNRKIDDLASVSQHNKQPIFIVKAVRDIDAVEPESKVKPLVKAAFARMKPIHRRLLKNVLKYGPGEPAATAAARLGLKPGTYAVYKKRAYESFDQAIDRVAKELGVAFLRDIPTKSGPDAVDFGDELEGETDRDEFDDEESESGFEESAE